MEYSAQRVRSKTRAAVRKREEWIEQDEMESGELNLIPYLDMVTNLMLFLLASVSAGLILSEINTTLPNKTDPGKQVTEPAKNPDDEPLGLYVSIQKNSMVLWSVSKREGTLKDPKPGYTFPRITGTQGQACDGPYMCEGNVCTDGVCVASKEDPQPVYPYRKLNDLLVQVAKTHYAGRQRKIETYTIAIQADGSIPYSAIVSVMAAMRCKLPDYGKETVACRVPNENPDFKKTGEALSHELGDGKGKYFNTEKANYDPTTMALFHNIQFSTGFE